MAEERAQGGAVRAFRILGTTRISKRELYRLLKRHGDRILAIALVVEDNGDPYYIARLKQHYGLKEFNISFNIELQVKEKERKETRLS